MRKKITSKKKSNLEALVMEKEKEIINIMEIINLKEHLVVKEEIYSILNEQISLF